MESFLEVNCRVHLRPVVRWRKSSKACSNNAREREFCRTVVMLYGGTYDEVLLMEAGMYFVFTN